MKYSMLVHGLSFKLIWVGTILLAANDQPALAAALIWGWSIFWWRNPDLQPYSSLAVKALLVGGFSELVLCYSQVSLSSTGEFLSFPPFWLLGLWVAFASLMPLCLKGLQNRLVLAGLVGALFAPLSYSTGSSWGAMTIQNDLQGLLMIGILWGAGFPFLLSQIESIATTRQSNELT